MLPSFDLFPRADDTPNNLTSSGTSSKNNGSTYPPGEAESFHDRNQ